MAIIQNEFLFRNLESFQKQNVSEFRLILFWDYRNAVWMVLKIQIAKPDLHQNHFDITRKSDTIWYLSSLLIMVG